MDTYKDAVVLNDLWAQRRRRGSCGRRRWSASGRRSVLVTGAHGLLGAWLVKALLERRRPRGGDPPRRAGRLDARLLGLADRVDAVHGDICDDGPDRAGADEYEVDSVFHLAAQTLVGDRQPLAAVDLRDQHPRHLAGARGLPAARRRAA